MNTGFFVLFGEDGVNEVYQNSARVKKKGLRVPISKEDMERLQNFKRLQEWRYIDGKLELPDVRQTALPVKAKKQINWKLVASHLAAAGAGFGSGLFV